MKISRRGSKGFSLIELLVALLIVGILAGLLAPALMSLITSSRLNDATEQIVQLADYARQAAIASNSPVEVRFYRFDNASANPTAGHYQAVQVFRFDSTGNVTALTKAYFLPAGIIIDSSATLSPLLGQVKNFSPPLDPKINIPRAGINYDCAAFKIFPSGSTALATTSWFVTLHQSNTGDALNSPPANYATVQIDPVLGIAKIYRP